MKSFFLNIYRYFNRHPVVLWTLLLLVTACCILSALRINFVEDISSFLPRNKENERINYAYELDRDDTSAMQTNAEEWITDKYAVNKARTKLLRHTGKFRQKTIDRKDEIFQNIKNALKK